MTVSYTHLIDGDSIDLEMRIQEGPQASISKVRINGNDRLYENVVRRELRTKPGDLFSKEALERSYRETVSYTHLHHPPTIDAFLPSHRGKYRQTNFARFPILHICLLYTSTARSNIL